jgi:hypothetical protein
MAIHNIIINSAYKGELLANRNMHIEYLDQTDMSKVIRIALPPIVDEKTWDVAQTRLFTNKRVRPIRKEPWLLQGLLTCGLCGRSYKPDKNGNRRYYFCRGTMKENHLDDSPKCTQKMIKADWLESEVLSRIKELLKDANKLKPLLEETIKNLKAKESDLRIRIQPMEERLVQLAEQRARLAEEWVTMSMSAEKITEHQRNIEQEETRLKTLKSSIDPAQLAELEQTRSTIRFWEEQVRIFLWNTENEDGSMVNVVTKPYKTFLEYIGLEPSVLMASLGLPSAIRELLDKLQVQLVAYEDRVEVKAVFPIAPIYLQLHHTSGEGDRDEITIRNLFMKSRATDVRSKNIKTSSQNNKYPRTIPH